MTQDASEASADRIGGLTSTTMLEQVAAGVDERAAGDFVRRYAPLVRTIALRRGLARQDCEDLAQEVMMAAVAALREQRYDRNLGRFRAWLKGVVHYKVCDSLQAKALREGRVRRPAQSDVDTGLKPAPRQPPADSRRLDELVDPHPAPDEQFEADFDTEWQKAAFEDALDQVRLEVDPLTFQAFDLYARKHRPPREVAKLLGVTRNAVYLAKSRVITRLRDKMGY